MVDKVVAEVLGGWGEGELDDGSKEFSNPRE
jgi:hypothetical protein